LEHEWIIFPFSWECQSIPSVIPIIIPADEVHHFSEAQMLHVWNIYLQNWVIFGVNVGKYSSTMEHLGRVGSTTNQSWF